MRRSYYFIFVLVLCISSCIPVTQEPITTVSLDVTNRTYQKIYDYQDKQQLDSLLLYTRHEDPSYRYLVANALASFQDEGGLDSLYVLLQDPVMKVRTAAAYAIGQIGSKAATTHLITAFKTKDTLDVDNSYNATILESIGKIGAANLLPSLATVSTYRSTDTLLLVGQARAIYNYALRGMTATEGTDRMVQYLTEAEYPQQVKTIAANYLARAKDLDLDIYKNRLMQVLEESPSADTRMAVALALGKATGIDVLAGLQRQYDVEKDYRVKANIVRALSNFPYIQIIEPMLKLLADEDLAIATTAANYLVNHGNSNDATIYRNYLTDSLHYEVKAKVYGAILEHMPIYYTNTKSKIKLEITALIEGSDNPYEQAAYTTALGHDPYNYQDILSVAGASKHAVVRSAGANAVSALMSSPNFIKAYRSGHLRKKAELLELIKEQIANGDVGVLAIYGELLADPTVEFKSVVEDAFFLEEAQRKLTLPKEIETYNSLGKAIAHLKGETYKPVTPAYNHPINWSIFNQYGDSVQVAIKTGRGVIRVRMYTAAAPGSVANFLTLAQDDFYDGKAIHRVVPNFVIQGGCPRGDGYGGLDYTIRSEVPQLYYEEEGLLGMASAGLHTEGTQWFVTHSPAMHLSGKYTIFGKVISGMDVVHKIQVGDKIEDVIITKG